MNLTSWNLLASIFQQHDAMSFPLLHQGEIHGVMTFFAHKISTPDKDFKDLLLMVGARLGDFMYHNARQKQLLDLAKSGGFSSIF
jgi:hypothetical protein